MSPLPGCRAALCALLLMVPAPPAHAPAAQSQVPSDLEIVLASSARPAVEGGDAELVQIVASGAVLFSAKAVEQGTLPEEQGTLPAEAIAAIWSTIEQQRFFELQEVYVDPDIADGDMAALEITANGTTHAVVTINIGVDAFDAIVEAINERLPEERQVIYNALHVEGYKRLAR